MLPDPHPPSTEIRHVYTPVLGSIDVKVAHGRDSVSVEIDTTRPRQEGETFEEAAQASAALSALAYHYVVAKLAEDGVEVGPFKKAAA